MTEPSTRLAENWRDSIESCMTFSSRDWSLNHRDAWIYGILFGYRPEALAEIKERHNWDDKTVARLLKLHRQYKEEKAQAASSAETMHELKVKTIASTIVSLADTMDQKRNQSLTSTDLRKIALHITMGAIND